MAALCPGVKYGLSSQENFGENKDLIFVKLTDSALRTIEEFLRNQNKYNKKPTIKFLGNAAGQLSFPTQNGNTAFNFSVSSATDMEGPGGSFECLQQLSKEKLGVLGSMPHKIRIHANDDVYETTRHRMSMLEENTKNKCAREIKMNQTDIGRKVKVKQAPGSVAPPPRRDPPSRGAGGGGTTTKPPYLPGGLGSKQTSPLLHHHPGGNGLSNGLGSNHVSSSRPQNKSLSDIARRPIKERLIHLLALRPFKKPELYERLQREGLRDRMPVATVLKQIAYMKDNSYHLNRAMWNEVHEDWTFYTESERQMLKRRKPQNLTPPGSSDGGSSGSGHSPTSTHPGSPPPPVTTSSSSKRPGYYDGVDGLQTKRQRISHYRKPTEQIYRPPAEGNTQRRPMTDSRDASNMNPRSRESPQPALVVNGGPPPPQQQPTPPLNNGCYTALLGKRSPITMGSVTDDEEHLTRKRMCDTYAGLVLDKLGCDVRSLSPAAKHPADEPQVNGTFGRGGGKETPEKDESRDRRDVDRWNKVSSSTQNNRIARVSPDSQSDRIAVTDSGPPRNNNDIVDDREYPDYLSEFTSIKDIDQRRKYKAEFNANYTEYRKLHGIVEKVSKRFAELEEQLKREDASSPTYKDIKKQIVKEYQANKQDAEHQRAKRRFQYLHEKLSHIKRLVFEYDQEMADGGQY